MRRNFQSRMANLKSVLLPERVVNFIVTRWPDASVVWATHDEPHKVCHTHYVVRWPSVVRWSCLADWLHLEDGHEYASPAISWRRSVRYLLHLDNPEKARIPRDSLHSCNIDQSELSMLLSAQRLPILESLVLAEQLPLSARFSFLVVDRGHSPSEVSAALRCMMDLERWNDTRYGRSLANGSAISAGLPDATLEHGQPAGIADLDVDFDFSDDFTDFNFPNDEES